MLIFCWLTFISQQHIRPVSILAHFDTLVDVVYNYAIYVLCRLRIHVCVSRNGMSKMVLHVSIILAQNKLLFTHSGLTALLGLDNRYPHFSRTAISVGGKS